MNKEVRDLERALVKQGFDVERSAKNHLIVRKDGRRLATIASTPSDPRALKNAVAPLRRAGFVWKR
ncbi:type II toxin-antitoxin system HicA family toxin [Kitasatospora sp. NPDC056783]|uniref:type II toxin-antitoxin system HicA family toxin n=1 Tax=Kitasatospora sp. NPDC056783 TaxID=3345943 RepID=UPI003677F6D2